MATLSPDQVRRSLRRSIGDGVFWAIMYGTGERYVLAFVVLGKAGLWWLAAAAALPGFVGAIFQCLSAEVVDKARRRKPFCILGSGGQAAMWLPLCLSLFLPAQQGLWVVLAGYALGLAFVNFGGPPWNSLMGDLVPIARRGRYFGLRNTAVGAGMIVSSLAAGWWLTWAEGRTDLAWLGLHGRGLAFLVLFAIAAVARGISSTFMARMDEPPYRPRPAERFSLVDFIRRAPRAHFGRYVFYCTVLNAGIGALTPFLFWYVLDVLGHSPVALAWLGVVNWLALYGSSYGWGWLADRIGSKRILVIAGLGLTAVPLLLFASQELWWIAVVQVYDGIMVAGYNNGTLNYLFDAVTPPKRARCTAYYSLFITAGTAAGALIAAVLGTCVPVPLDLAGWQVTHSFQLLLLASAALRLAPTLLLGSFAEFRLSRPVFVPVGQPDARG